MDSPVPKRLKEARLAAKISQKKLGIAAGMDEFSASARMNHYEMGRHTPDYSTIKRIADVLKVPTAFFYAEENEVAEVLVFFHKLTSSQKKSFINQIQNFDNT